MKTCEKCGKTFPIKLYVNNKFRNFQRRKFCLTCSPFGSHNTSKIVDKKERETINKIKDKQKNKNRSKNISECRKKIKLKLILYKGGKCEKCGYSKCISCLVFHHKDPKEKERTISGNIASYETLKKESDKCILLCRNCHGELHHGCSNLGCLEHNTDV